VLDGRDIGTVIAPDAQAKLFVTASPQVRAERRWKQLTGQGETVAFEDILADIRIRDERDSGRAPPRWSRPRRGLARHQPNDYRSRLRCGPPYRRGGARPLGQSKRASPSIRQISAGFLPFTTCDARTPLPDSAVPHSRTASDPMADDMSLNPTRDDFSALLDEAFGGRDFAEGTVVHGKVVAIEKDFAIVDVGLKTEGRIALKEFGVGEDGKPTLKVGDTVEVFLERVENALGEAVISREKAKREEAWTRLEGVFALNEPVMGAIVGRVKGGFTVDLGGASAFLPGSKSTSARCATSAR
jgi:hypothetical protein